MVKAVTTPEKFREQFPVFNSVTYLASCTQGALANQVAAAVKEDFCLMYSEGVSWQNRGLKAEEARRAIAGLINADVDEIALLPSATIAYYQVLSAINEGEKGRVLSTNLEFPSIGHVLQTADATRNRVEFLTVPTATWDSSGLMGELRDDALLLSVPHVCYNTGLTVPLEDIVSMAHDANIEVVSDVYQSVGVIPIDVKALKIDYLVGGTLKYALGVPGLGFAYVRRDKLPKIKPKLTGWQGRVNPVAFTVTPVDFPATARKMEIGTPSVLSNYAAGCAIGLLNAVGGTSIYHHVHQLAVQLTMELLENNFALLSPEQSDFIGPMVVVSSKNPERLGAQLASHKVIVGPRGAGVRVSFHYYNTESDVQGVVNALRKIRKSEGSI